MAAFRRFLSLGAVRSRVLASPLSSHRVSSSAFRFYLFGRTPTPRSLLAGGASLAAVDSKASASVAASSSTRMCVCCGCCVCYDTCMSVCAFVCWNATFINLSFVIFFVCSTLLLLLPYHVCITPRLKLWSPLLCCSHGTAVAQQVCVDCFYACVGTAYACVMCGMIRKRVPGMWHVLLLLSCSKEIVPGSRTQQEVLLTTTSIFFEQYRSPCSMFPP